MWKTTPVILILSNPIFLPPTYSPALFILGEKEVGGLLVIILQFKREKHKQKQYNLCYICWLKSVLHEEKRREQENHVGQGPT
jgi:hypothetical protein